MKRYNPVGTKTHMLTVMSEIVDFRDYAGVKRRMWLCLCECGGETICSIYQVKGAKQSCGCLRGTSIDHGLADHPLYKTWYGIKLRCFYKNHGAYKYYGGRGITLCDRWLDVAVFIADMGDKPTPQHTIDRIDNDGNYEPSNCKWSTRSEQNENKRGYGSSKIKGVGWHKAAGKWRAFTRIDGRQKQIGTFSTEAEAESAYKEFIENV